MILSAFVDDSGSDEASRYFVLAGYVMQAPFWEAFSDEWASGLRREPTIEYFHMADAEYGDGNLKGLGEPLRKLKVNELSDVISKFEPLAVSSWLSWESYRKIARANIHPKIDSPYAVLFYQVMRAVHEFQIKTNPQGKYHRVDFVFDDQSKIGFRALQWYSALKTAAPEPYKSMMGVMPVFEDDKKIVALQAADMLAWHVHRELEHPEEKRPVLDKIRKPFASLGVSDSALRSFVELSKRANPDELAKGI